MKVEWKIMEDLDFDPRQQFVPRFVFWMFSVSTLLHFKGEQCAGRATARKPKAAGHAGGQDILQLMPVDCLLSSLSSAALRRSAVFVAKVWIGNSA